MIKVLFVCLGNICRSPMAEFVLKQMVAQKGLSDQFEIASAATSISNEICHEAMDFRAADILRQMKVPFSEHYSYHLRKTDYAKFDYILAMDDNNVRNILDIVGEDKNHKIHRLLDYSDKPRSIKDPWYTGNFDEAYWDIYEGCQTFLDFITRDDRRPHADSKK